MHVVARAAKDDIPSLVALMAEFYAESSHPLDADRAEASFERLLGDASRGAAWIARRGDDIAGYVVLTLKHSMEAGIVDAFVDDLFVRPQFRRAGVASSLLSALFDHCRKVHAGAVHVEVGPDNAAALALYHSFGLLGQDRQVLTAPIKETV